MRITITKQEKAELERGIAAYDCGEALRLLFPQIDLEALGHYGNAGSIFAEAILARAEVESESALLESWAELKAAAEAIPPDQMAELRKMLGGR